MQGVEQKHCDAAIQAVLTANLTLQNATIEELLQPVSGTYGKKDTLGLDARPEIDIVQIMRRYDENCIVITEEAGAHKKLHLTHSHDANAFRTIYVSDPTDRSSQLKKFLSGAPDHSVRFREFMAKDDAVQSWEKIGGGPASITGAFTALTCIRHSVPIFSVLVNYITQKLFVSCSAGNYRLPIPRNESRVDLEYIKQKGTKLFFPAMHCRSDNVVRRFVTFIGKEGYRENLIDSQLMPAREIENLLHYPEPGGPSRMLYLSTLQPADTPIGLVLANGEKIGEWIHWLPWVMFARREDDQSEPALSMFEIYRHDQIRIKDGVLMSTPPFYSIFKKAPGGDKMIVDIARFSDFDNPSKIRSSLIVCPTGNSWATGLVKQCGYRQIEF